MGNAVEAYKGRKADEIVTAVLALYEEGKEVDEAAALLDVPARTIYRWLASNAQDKWTEAQRGRLVSDYEKARKHRDDASNTLEVLKTTLDEEDVKEPAERNWRLAHAREVLRAADTALDHQKWLLERLLKRVYGQDQAVDSGGRVTITLNISGDSATPQRTIEHNSENDSQEQAKSLT